MPFSADLLVAAIAAITAAGLLTVSFLTDKFVDSGGGLPLNSDSYFSVTTSLGTPTVTLRCRVRRAPTAEHSG